MKTSDKTKGILGFLKTLLYNGTNQASLTDFIALLLALLFVVGSLFLLVTGATWTHYDMFAEATVVGSVATKILKQGIYTADHVLSKNKKEDEK